MEYCIIYEINELPKKVRHACLCVKIVLLLLSNRQTNYVALFNSFPQEFGSQVHYFKGTGHFCIGMKTYLLTST